MREKILNLIASSESGVTSRDLAIALRCPRPVIARRLSELKAEGLIRGTGEYEAGAAIVTVTPQQHLGLEWQQSPEVRA